MTHNQIEYQKHLESRRSNLASELQKNLELQETQRRNLADEGIRVVSNRNQRYGTDVQREHYERSDATATSKLAEEIRSNLVNENRRELERRDQASYWSGGLTQGYMKLDQTEELEKAKRDLEEKLKQMDISQRDRQMLLNFAANMFSSLIKGAGTLASMGG